jgi:PTH2 family peptidyl-tRNA hydrolase
LHNEPKQVIVVRRDLKMGKGKMAAQVAHASVGALTQWAYRSTAGGDGLGVPPLSVYGFPIGSPAQVWLDNQKFTKICLYVDSEKELDMIHAAALEASIPAVTIIDNGLTEFNGVLTKTCVGIGPHWPEVIDKITGHLKLA